MSRIDLDLDTIVKPQATVKLNGEVLTVTPPSLEQLLKLTRAGMELENKKDDDDILKSVDEIMQTINTLIPELKDKEISLPQLFKLIDFMGKMAVPAENQELARRGISVGGEQKKTPSDQ